MKKIIRGTIFVLLVLIFSIQFCGCKLLPIKEEDNSSKKTVESSSSAMSITLKLGDGNTVNINLNEKVDENLLSSLNIDELTLLRYAYYAKYDYEFASKDYVDYFNQYSWYEPINEDVDNSLTLIDKENIVIIREYEERLTSSELPIPSTQTDTLTQTEAPVQNDSSYSHDIWLRISDGRTISVNLDSRVSSDLLWQLTSDELSYIRNGYYAKHGYIFSMKKYADYFNQYSWYEPLSKNVESKLTSLDRENVALVQEYEKEIETSNSWSDDCYSYYYIWIYLNDGTDVFVDLEGSLNEEFLWYLNSENLAILRNAYYAKNGYTFSKQKYVDYFYQYPWYYPDTKNVENRLSNTDKQNIALIQKYE